MSGVGWGATGYGQVPGGLVSDYQAELEQRLARAERTLEALASREHIATVVPWSGLSGGVVYVDPSGTGALTTEAAFIYDDVNNELVAGRLRVTEQATPGTPANPYATLFADSNGVMSSVDDAGVVREMVRRARGTFSPTYFGQTTAGVTTYAVQVGRYERLGTRVDFTLYVNWTNATGTGNALVGNLPFTSENVANQFVAPNSWYSAITFAAGTGVRLLFRPNTTQIELWTQPASNVAAAQLGIEVAGEIAISGTYYLAS